MSGKKRDLRLLSFLIFLGVLVTSAAVWAPPFYKAYAVGLAAILLFGRHLLLGQPKRDLVLQSSQPFQLEPAGGTIEISALYSAAIQLTVHSDANSWARLYNFLTANSILMLGWATVYEPASAPGGRADLPLAVALGGLALSLVWAPSGSRNRRLHRRWGDVAKVLEEKDHPGMTVGPTTAALAIKYLWIEEKWKTGFLVVFVPIVFAALFLFAVLKSLWLFI